jgi:hypothetical protein
MFTAVCNTPKNKRTFIAPSHGFLLTCRGEKYAILCTGYSNLVCVYLLVFFISTKPFLVVEAVDARV